MITHANLADNLNLIVTGLSAVDDTVVVGWLPQVTGDLSYSSTTWERNTREGQRSAIGGAGKIYVSFLCKTNILLCYLYVYRVCGRWLSQAGRVVLLYCRLLGQRAAGLTIGFTMGPSPTVHTLSSCPLCCWCARCCVHCRCFQAAFARST